MKCVFCVLGLLLPLASLALAQGGTSLSADPFLVSGKFYVSVDDSAQLFLNGVQIYEASIGESASPQVHIKPGDRLFVKLANFAGPRRFAIMFASTERKTAISFTSESFKLVQDPDVLDLTERQVGALRRFSNQAGKGTAAKVLPFPNSSEWIWGDSDQCKLGAVLTRGMFKPLPR